MGLFLFMNVKAGNIWIDNYGTSSTAGTWNSGIRSDTLTTIYPPYVKRWEKYEWSTPSANVVPSLNFALIYNGYVYFGQGNQGTGKVYWDDPGYVWAWDIQTGVTKTGYPLGPTDSGIISMGGLVIGNNDVYAITQHMVYGWDINTLNLISGFPIDITETAGQTEQVVPEDGIIYWQNKLYFVIGDLRGNTADMRSYLFVKDANNGSELWRKQLSMGGGQTPAIWNGRVYVAGRTDQQIHCWDANTGADCANFPVSVTGTMRAMPVIENGIIYIGDESGYFYSIDATTGNINWSITTPHPYLGGNDQIISTASIWNDKVYFGTHTGMLYGLYKANGTFVSGFPTNYSLSLGGDGPISTANGVVYSANVYGYAVDANNGNNVLWQGNPVWTYGGGVSFEYNYPSATIGQNEIVMAYPSANGLVVYCMPSPTASPTVSPTITGTPPTITETETITPTMTYTSTFTFTGTYTITVTITESQTITPSFTSTISPTVTMTLTITQTLTQTVTYTITPTVTEIPASFYFKLITNSPNPAKDYTYIIYELGMEAEVKVNIYTISGEKVTTLDQQGSAGKKQHTMGLQKFRRQGCSKRGIYI